MLYTLTVTERELALFESFIDYTLKGNGLAVLNQAVEAINILRVAKKVEEAPVEKEG